MDKLKNIGEKGLIFVFVFIIFFISVYYIVSPDKKYSYVENRNLEQKPKVTLETVLDGTYMQKLEKYLNDQVFFRDGFVNLSTNLKLGLGQKEINNVYIGKDYLIETFNKQDIDEDLVNKNFEYIQEFMKKHDNSELMLIPTATEILKDKIPKYSTNINQKELIEGLGNTIDVYSELMKHNQEEIYYKTDHHWTTLGAYYGYLAVCEKLGLNALSLDEFDKEVIDKEFSGTIQSKVNIPFEKDVLYKYVPKYFNGTYERIVDEDIKSKSDSLYDESKLKSKEKYAVYIGGNTAITRIKTEGGKEDKGRILLIKDSFSHSLAPFLTNHYSEVVLIDLRYFNAGAEWLINREESFDDILLVYNLKTFVKDKNLMKLNKK